MEDKKNGSGDLPLMPDPGNEPESISFTPGEKIIMEKLVQLEKRMQSVESPSTPQLPERPPMSEKLVCPHCGGTSWGGGTDDKPEPWCTGCGAPQGEAHWVKTRVNSERVLCQMEDGFMYVAPEGYTGPICETCHMPPLETCRKDGGIVGYDHDTQQPQMDPRGPVSHWKACPQKLDWRNNFQPIERFSTDEKSMPEPGSPISTLSEIENLNGQKKN